MNKSCYIVILLQSQKGLKQFPDFRIEKKHVKNVCHEIHKYLTKSRFDTAYDS